MELYEQFEVVVESNERRACDRSKYSKMYGHKILEQTIVNSNAIQNGKGGLIHPSLNFGIF